MQLNIVPQEFPFVKRISLKTEIFLIFLNFRVKKGFNSYFLVVFSKKRAEAKVKKCLGKKTKFSFS